MQRDPSGRRWPLADQQRIRVEARLRRMAQNHLNAMRQGSNNITGLTSLLSGLRLADLVVRQAVVRGAIGSIAGQLEIFNAETNDEIDAAFANMLQW